MKGDCIVCGKKVERSPSLFSKTGQPLWAADNLRKNDKLAAPFQPQLSYAQGKAA
jgi:hypothetical protein